MSQTKHKRRSRFGTPTGARRDMHVSKRHVRLRTDERRLAALDEVRTEQRRLEARIRAEQANTTTEKTMATTSSVIEKDTRSGPPAYGKGVISPQLAEARDRARVERMAQKRQQALDALRRLGRPSTATEITAEYGSPGSVSTVRKYMQEFIQQGQVVIVSQSRPGKGNPVLYDLADRPVEQHAPPTPPAAQPAPVVPVAVRDRPGRPNVLTEITELIEVAIEEEVDRRMASWMESRQREIKEQVERQVAAALADNQEVEALRRKVARLEAALAAAMEA